ncbi:MAG: DUF1987 domain-containing protein [Bacteroidales bacterium]|nr:DUF1987 domain-containing protein [Bacteroidales bacterium]MBR4349235.1 DUF1987 domain-containing protein [Bacteroidales bacterium]
MEVLHIEGTEDTPEVLLDSGNNTFSISGRSFPENAIEFYEPIFAWLQKYAEEVENDMEFEFCMEYFNTSSSKQIAKIFLLLEKINENVFVQVIWKYKKEDSDMMASGMRFSKLLNLEFELREVE